MSAASLVRAFPSRRLAVLLLALIFADTRLALAQDASPAVLTGTDEGAGVVRLFTATGTQIAAAMPFGSFVGGIRVAVGDLNADGIPDFVLGTGPGAGVVRAFSGADYSMLFAATPFGPAFAGGVYVATGDINGDGHDDIIAGAGQGSGLVQIYSGANGQRLVGAPPFSSGYAGGVTVATGDVNGDGHTDVITAMASGGLVRIFDGASLSVMAAGYPYGQVFAGGIHVAAGDVNNDGRDEVIVAPRRGGSLLHIVSVSQGILVSFAPYPGVSGLSVATGDVDGDGAADIVVGPGSPASPHVRVFSYALQRELVGFLAHDPAFRGGVYVAAWRGGVRFLTPNAVTFTLGTPQQFIVRTNGGEHVTLALEGALPPGVSFIDNGDGTGSLAGAPAAGSAGVYALQFVARRGATEVGRQAFTLTVEGSGTSVAITSSPATAFVVGVQSSFVITTSGTPVASTITVSGALPFGVAFTNNGDGTATLSGTPGAGTDGTYPLVITASNGTGATATQHFTLTVASEGMPLITSADSATFSVGAAGSFLVTTIANPAASTISLSGALPAGLSFVNHTNGTATILGRPASGTAGTYALTLEASNGTGAATQALTLRVENPAGGAPTITSANTVTFAVGEDRTFTITTTGTPPVDTIVRAGALPPGVSFTDQGNGTATLSGSPASGSAGVYSLAFTASNTVGSATQPFTLTVVNVGAAPVFTSGSAGTIVVGTPGTITITTAADPAVTAIGVTGTLPAGITFADNADGTASLVGTPAAGTAGSYPLVFTASNGVGGPVSQAFVLVVNEAPSITSANTTTFSEQIAGSFTITTAGTPVPALTVSGALPSGVTVVDNGDGTATLSGTPAAGSAGNYPLTLTATNGIGAPAVMAFTLRVIFVNQPPSFTIGPDQTIDEDAGPQSVANWATSISPGPGETTQSVTFEVVGNTNPSLFAAGPAVSPAGQLTYTPAPNANGVATVTIQLRDNGGTADGGVDVSPPQSFTITINPVDDAPVITVTPGTTLTYTEGDPASEIDAAVSIVDVDDTHLESATLQLEANYQSGFDVLSFVNQSGIVGSWNPATGTLTLTGTATLADYSAALRTVTFANTSNNPLQAPRTVLWTVNDGTASSAPATNAIAVVAINDPPVVANETFELFGNTELRVDMSAGTTPHTSETTSGPSPLLGLLDNDTDPEGDPLAVTQVLGCTVPDDTAPFDCTLTDGAVVHVEASGAFSYTPAPGATSGSFTYAVTDAPAQGVPSTVNGTVTFTFFERIWYIDGDAAPGGNGTSVAPFNDFSAVNAPGGAGDADLPGDYLFVHDSAVAGGIELEENQRLIGEGVGLSIDRSLNGNSTPTVLVAPGVRPRITNDAGDAVSVTTLMAAEIAGLALAGSVNAIDVTTSAALGGSPVLTIRDNEILSAGAEGIDVTLGPGTSGTLTLNIRQNTWDVSGTHGPNAVDIIRNSGVLVLDFSGNTNVKSTVRSVVIDGGNMADMFITGLANNSVHGSAGGHAFNVSHATFDADLATPALQPVVGGTLRVGASGDPVGTRGVQLLDVQGSLQLTDLDVFAGESGLTVTGGGAGFGLAVTPAASGGSSTIAAQFGAAVDITNATIDLQLAAVSSNTAAGGISLSGVSGIFSAGSGSSITKSTGGGAAFAVSNSSAAVTYGGTMNVSSGAGVSLVNNTGAVLFTGQLTLNTGANPAFSATGSAGTVAATHTVNTLSTTTGTALLVDGPDIGPGGLVFRSISTDGAATGILLSDTGSLGLTVLGIGTPGSGGTITGSTGPGISLTNTGPVSLSHMNIANGADDGIRGSGVNGLHLTGVAITGNGDGAGEHGIDVTELTGSATMTNVTVSGSAENNVRIANTAGTLAALDVTSSAFAGTNVTTGSHGFLLEQNGTGVMTVAITGSTFTDNRGEHLALTSAVSAAGSISLTFNSNTLSTTALAKPSVLGGGIRISPSGSTAVTFTISGNDIQEAVATAIDVDRDTASTAASSLIGTISNNTIGSPSVPNSGSANGSGIAVVSRGLGLATVAVVNNQVHQYAAPSGIFVSNRDGSSTLNATVTGNTVSNPGTSAINGLRVEAGATGAPADSGFLCALVTGNTVAGSGAPTDIQLIQALATTIRLPGYPGAANDTSAVNAFVQGNNGGGITVLSSENTLGGGGGFVGGPACPVP